MIDSLFTLPSAIRNRYRQGGNARLSLQRAMSLGMATSSIGEAQGVNSGAGLSTSGSAGMLSYQSGSIVNPAETAESISPIRSTDESLLNDVDVL